MKKSSHFTRLSSTEAKSIATQVAVGVISETKKALATTRESLAANLQDEEYKHAVLGVNQELSLNGVQLGLEG